MIKGRRNYTLLNIDDDDEFNVLLKRILKNLNLKVVSTTDPKDFIEKLKTEEPDICLIDLNLGSSFGAGFQLIKALRKVKGPEIPLLVMSKRASKEDIVAALDAGANDYLTKPIDRILLFNKINEYIRLYGEVVDSLPFYTVAKDKKRAEFSFDLEIVNMTENGLTICGTVYISQGTHIMIKNSLLAKLTASEESLVTVQKSWIVRSEDGMNDLYYAFLEFGQEDFELRDAAKAWIVEYAQTVSAEENKLPKGDENIEDELV